MGRWETRLALLATIGLLITLIFTLVFGSTGFLFVLLYVAVFGVIWDVIYIALQQFAGTATGPPFFRSSMESPKASSCTWSSGSSVYPECHRPLARLFIAHYGLVWLAIFLFTQGPMRAIFPFWRFHGA